MIQNLLLRPEFIIKSVINVIIFYQRREKHAKRPNVMVWSKDAKSAKGVAREDEESERIIHIFLNPV